MHLRFGHCFRSADSGCRVLKNRDLCNDLCKNMHSFIPYSTTCLQFWWFTQNKLLHNGWSILHKKILAYCKGNYPGTSCNILITLHVGGRGATKPVGVIQHKQTQTKTTQQNNTEKLSTKIRQTSSHRPARENAQGFPLHLVVIHILFLHHLDAASLF